MSQDPKQGKTYWIDLTADEVAQIEYPEPSCGEQLENMRADRDSLRDALDALERVTWQLMSEHGQYSADDWQALESARHVLGSKRA